MTIYNLKQKQGAASEGTSERFFSINTICAAWLKENGYDGLCHPVIECGCSILDFMPCESPGFNTCVAAHKELQNDGDWLMFPGKSNVPHDLCAGREGDMKKNKFIPHQVDAVVMPKIICLCGSTRFTEQMLVKQWELTKEGFIVVTYCALPDSYFQ